MPIELAEPDTSGDRVMLALENIKRMDVSMPADDLIAKLAPYLESRGWLPPGEPGKQAAQAAMRTMHQLRYTYNGGQLWKPPLGKAPDFAAPPQPELRIEGFAVFARKDASEQWVMQFPVRQHHKDAERDMAIYTPGHELAVWPIYSRGPAPAIDPRDARCEADARGIIDNCLKGFPDFPIVERYLDGLAMAVRATDSPIDSDELARIGAQVRGFYTWLTRQGEEPKQLAGGMSEEESWAREALAARESEWNAWRFTEQVMAHISSIGLRRSDDKLFLTIKAPEGHTLHIPIAVPPWEPQAFPLTAWMTEKQRLLHSIGPRQRHADEPHETGVWYRWDGQVYDPKNPPSCPVAHRTPVTVRFRDGEEKRVEQPECMRWAWSRPWKSCADIVAYRLEDDELPF